MMLRWSLAVQGGAGSSAQDDDVARVALGRALDAGGVVLDAGGAAVDAVEAAVVALENDPLFNAGRGAVLNFAGSVELDAAIMDGHGRRAGAVAGVTRTRNPVRLARAVMEHGVHVFLSRAGADAFSVERGLEQADPAWFVTAERQRQWREFVSRRDPFDAGAHYGTVGAVGRDVAGHVAAATSTGGLTGKRWGRIGDSPVIGAGTYADDLAGAVSATGSGEAFLRAAAAHAVCFRMKHLGENAQAAAETVIAEVGALGGRGGLIVVAPDGSLAWSFSTPAMYRGLLTSDGRRVIATGDDEPCPRA